MNTLDEVHNIWEDVDKNQYVGDIIYQYVQELKSLNNQLETAKEPTILENIKTNMEETIKACIGLEIVYPNSIWKLKDAEVKFDMVKERYNERLYLIVKKSLEEYKLKMAQSISERERDLETESIFEQIQYIQGFIENSAKNYQDCIDSFIEFHDDVEDLFSSLMYNDLDIAEAFTIVLEKTTFKDYITDIAKLICDNELKKENIDSILKQFNIYNIKDIKLDLLDLLLSYINIVINTHIITEKERRNIETLKLYFRIKEGDFYKYRCNEIKFVCQKQFARLSRNNMDYSDELFWVGIQDMFDLSYSQLEKLSKK